MSVCPPPAQLDLFPEFVRQLKSAGPNALSESERHKLVVGVIPWCRKLARKHCDDMRRRGRKFEREDLESEAYVAATEAAMYFDPRHGTQFTTYASAWIRTHLAGITAPGPSPTAALMECPDRVPDRDESDAAALIEPDAREAALLRNLPEPTREIVRLFIFGELAPDRIAEQLDMPLKDVRLHLRNAAGRIGKADGNDLALDRMIEASGNAFGETRAEFDKRCPLVTSLSWTGGQGYSVNH